VSSGESWWLLVTSWWQLVTSGDPWTWETEISISYFSWFSMIFQDFSIQDSWLLDMLWWNKRDNSHQEVTRTHQDSPELTRSHQEKTKTAVCLDRREPLNSYSYKLKGSLRSKQTAVLVFSWWLLVSSGESWWVLVTSWWVLSWLFHHTMTRSHKSWILKIWKNNNFFGILEGFAGNPPGGATKVGSIWNQRQMKDNEPR
jgi:hypothetical protein